MELAGAQSCMVRLDCWLFGEWYHQNVNPSFCEKAKFAAMPTAQLTMYRFLLDATRVLCSFGHPLGNHTRQITL